MKRRGAVLVLAFVAMAGLSAGPARAAAVLVVDVDGGGCQGRPAGFTSIQAAVAAAQEGDTVVVCPGTYAETVAVTPRT